MTDTPRGASKWSIRPFEPGDAPAVRRLIESVWHEHFHHHADPFVRDFIYPRLADIDSAKTVYGDRALFLCAIAENEIIGIGALKRLGDREGEMVRMFVAAAHRGRGVGRAIADELIKFARLERHDRIRLSSNNALVASHRFYERLGFQPAASWEPDGETHSRYYSLQISPLGAEIAGDTAPAIRRS